jgi:hypothetical protein
MKGRRRRTQVLLVWILALSGTGAWFSGQLVKQHANLWGSEGPRTGLYARMCQAADRAGLSCTAATRGPWSEIRVPIPLPTYDWTIHTRTAVVPIAFLSLAYFVFMAVWFAFIGPPRPEGHAWHRLPLTLGLCGTAASLFYLGVMAFGSAPGCVWCLAVHLINFLMVHAVWRLCAGAPRPDGTTALDLSPAQLARTVLTSREVKSVITFALILVVGLWAYRRERLALQDRFDRLLPYRHLVTSLRQDPEFLLREYYAQPQYQIPPRPQEPVADGQPRLVVFTDFECSACYCNALALRGQISRTFNGQLAILVRHYPLCSTCNDNVQGACDANACEAAYAAEAARLQGGQSAFAQMCALLFEHRTRLGRELYRELATRIGLDPDRLVRDMEQEPVRQIVAADVALAKKLGVTGTPTMFLEGRRVTELCRGSFFWKTIAENCGISPEGDEQPVAAIQNGLAANAGSRKPVP